MSATLDPVTLNEIQALIKEKTQMQRNLRAVLREHAENPISFGHCRSCDRSQKWPCTTYLLARTALERKE